MTDHARRALIGVLAISAATGAVAAFAGPPQLDVSVALADDGAAPGLEYWQRLERVYRRAEARSEAASLRSDALDSDTPEHGEAWAEACRKGQLTRSLAESAAFIAARDWPSLSIKLAILRHSAGADQLSNDEAFDVLEADIRHVIAAAR